MSFGGAGGPVFPTEEEQAWIDDAQQRVHDHNWPSDERDALHAKLSWRGLAIAIGCLIGIAALVFAIGAFFLW